MSTTSQRLMRALIAAMLVGFVCAPPVAAQSTADPAASPEAATVKKLLEQKFPGAAVSNVSKSAYFGLYEAQFDGQLVYTDAKVGYVMVGSIYDANTKQNLTEDRLRKLNRVAWDSLPFELAMKKVKGNGTRKLAVFSDADCPFCARLENELKGVDDVTIYTFLYPIDQLHPDAARKSKIIWCSPGPAEGVGRVLCVRQAARQQGRLRYAARRDAHARRKAAGQRDAHARLCRRLDRPRRAAERPAGGGIRQGRSRGEAGRGDREEVRAGGRTATTGRRPGIHDGDH